HSVLYKTDADGERFGAVSNSSSRSCPCSQPAQAIEAADLHLGATGGERLLRQTIALWTRKYRRASSLPRAAAAQRWTCTMGRRILAPYGQSALTRRRRP